CFFFSSRRRHTRFSRDWSSDVCSSDLNRDLRTFRTTLETTENLIRLIPSGVTVVSESGLSHGSQLSRLEARGVRAFLVGETLMRSEERRVGKELRSRWRPEK